MSTLREPYRIEGKKTLGLELARQLGWKLPDAIIYPAGGGTGLIGMWLAFQELIARRLGDGFAASSVRGAVLGLRASRARHRARGRPMRALGRSMDGRERASGAGAARRRAHAPRHPRNRRRRGGGAATKIWPSAPGSVSRWEGVDLAPEGGAAMAAAVALREAGAIGPDERVVVFNTGAGWLYRG